MLPPGTGRVNSSVISVVSTSLASNAFLIDALVGLMSSAMSSFNKVCIVSCRGRNILGRYWSINDCRRMSIMHMHNCATKSKSDVSVLTEDEENTVDHLATDILSRNNDVSNSDSNDSMSSQHMNQRIALSKAITLVESKSHRKRRMADVLLERLKQSDKDDNIRSSFRLGIAGPPGGE